MAVTQSTDAFHVYRGTEAKISSLNTTPIKDGNVYFAYDSDVIYFDAKGERHRIAGGGDVQFVKANDEVAGFEDGTEDNTYLFDRADIAAAKLNVDNIILTSDDIFYRVVEFRDGIRSDVTGDTTAQDANEEITVVVTHKVVGGGDGSGGGGGAFTIATPKAGDNPKALGWYEFNNGAYIKTNDTEVDENKTYFVPATSDKLSIVVRGTLPDRILVTQPFTFTLRFNSKTSTDQFGAVRVYLNERELDYLTVNNQQLRTDKSFTIPGNTLAANTNTIRVWLSVNGQTTEISLYVTGIVAVMQPTAEWKSQRPFGTDPVDTVAKTIEFPFTFTGLDPIAKTVTGAIKAYIDGVEYEKKGELMTMVGSDTLIGPIVTNSGTITLNCTNELYADIKHGAHTLTMSAYVVIGGEYYPVQTYDYDIIWATEEGGSTPIIITNYSNLEEENYNVVEIPYVVYAKGVEKQETHLYLNGNELATSPINVEWDTNLSGWHLWRLTNYNADPDQQPNILRMIAGSASKTIEVNIVQNSSMNLDPVKTGLLLYLSANERSNKEILTNRKSWKYQVSENETIEANLTGFNWYNNGWMTDDNGDSVLRLSNGAAVSIPFNKILNTANIGEGFAIEVEFRCRNATSFSKLLTLESTSAPIYDSFGRPVYMLDSDHSVLVYQEDLEPTEETDEETGEIITIPAKYTNADLYKDGTGAPIQAEEAGAGVTKVINYEDQQKTKVKNAVGGYFASQIGFCIGTQEAFFASSGKTVNVRYADNDKVRVSFVGDPDTQILYVYINGVLSGIEKFTASSEKFNANAGAITFNSDYCDLDLYNLRVYSKPLNFDDIVKNYIADAPNLDVKRQRYLENHITTKYVNDLGQELNYVTIDYKAARELSDKMEAQYQAALKTGKTDGVCRGLPIMVFSTYPKTYSDLEATDALPYNKKNIKYVDVRYYDPADKYQSDPKKRKSFKGQNVYLTVQGTSSQGYPRRNYKMKLKNSGEDSTLYGKYDFYLTTWDGRDDWSIETEKENLSETDAALINSTVEIWPEKDDDGNYSDAWNGSGFTTLKKFDVGNGMAETSFCLKADYMDSSSSHNTPLANYVDVMSINGSGYDLRHPMKKLEGHSAEPYRTTVYGIPILCFWDHKLTPGSAPQFVGRYNFNIDKSATGSFGFKVTDEQPYMRGKEYISPKKKLKGEEWKSIKDDFDNLTPITRVLGQTKEDIVDYLDSENNLVYPVNIGTEEEPQIVYYTTDPETTDPSELVAYEGEVHTSVRIAGSGDYAYQNPTYEEICECWELTSNQHGFTGFRRNDFGTVDDDHHLDFYNFWECRYSIMDFDPGDMYDADDSATKDATNTKLRRYMKNIEALSRWVYSTDVHPWDKSGGGALTEQERINSTSETAHKLNVCINKNDINLQKYNYYMKVSAGVVAQVPAENFVRDNETGEYTITSPLDNSITLHYSDVYYDDCYAKLDNDAWFLTLDDDFEVTLATKRVLKTNHSHIVTDEEINNETYTLADCDIVDDETRVTAIKDYYIGREGTKVDLSMVTRVPVYGQGDNTHPIGYRTQVAYTTEINGVATTVVLNIKNAWEKFDHDTRSYRLGKYRAEFNKHLNKDYMAFYFILTEFCILYDSREKNMMIATWGPEEENGEYIWYPIFYDMDTQLGINNSGTVYWDYDVNAQDDGIFSGAGSVLWDNFYACFLPEIKTMYRALRVSDKGLTLKNLINYYNTKSADCWTPIMKNVDAFYKYIAPSIASIGYTDQAGKSHQTRADLFYCAQGDRSLNRAAFFRNRLNYKDSEWLAGAYQTQGGSPIQMRYDANAANTSDPDNPEGPIPTTSNPPGLGWTQEKINTMRTDGLDANATFELQPYLTQYCSVYYDEIPTSPIRYDVQKPSEQIVRDDGYVKIAPLQSIQETIDSGLPLGQQLVYIYGPEYVRDMGDLSLKYLDEFLASSAVRLNRLQMGNDNVNYFNAGIKNSSFQLDTDYEDTEHNLNQNAKALLEYLDLSNLSGLSGTLGLTGCLKLKTLKALGTQYTTIALPSGNVLKRLYLPKTTTVVQLIQSQYLTTTIRDKSLTNAFTLNNKNYKIEGNIAEGLYIEGITDVMNILDTNNEGTVYPTATNINGMIDKYLGINSGFDVAGLLTSRAEDLTAYRHNIAQYQVEAGNLGFITYELLDFFVKAKLRIFYDSSIDVNDKNVKRDMSIRLTEVDWSPYKKVDIGASEINGMQYFIRTDKQTYETIASRGITFAEAQRSYGGAYTYDATYKLITNPVLRQGEVGIPDLRLFDLFLSDWQNQDKIMNSDTPANLYMFHDTYEAAGFKFLPRITGEVFVNNTQATAISEYHLYELMSAFNKELTSEDTPLTICAKYVTECPRAKFVIVGEDGVQNTYQMYRAQNYTDNVIPAGSDMREPSRNRYDFRGWTTDTSVIATNGVVLEDSDILNTLVVHVNVDEATEFNTQTRLKQLKFGTSANDAQKTYYAVFTLHKYRIRYILKPDLYIEDPSDETSYEDMFVPAEEIVGNYRPTHIPYKNSDDLELTKVWAFKGWTGANGNTTVMDDKRTSSIRDIERWPVFERASVYNSPIDNEYLQCKIQGNSAFLYGITKKYGGKVCIPKYYTDPNTNLTYPITTIQGPKIAYSQETMSYYFYKQSGQTYIPGGQPGLDDTGYALGQEAPEGYEGNGLALNHEITHIFFQGAADDSAVITTLDSYSMCRMFGLRYLDMPSSLTTFNSNCCSDDIQLTFGELPYATFIDSGAFNHVNVIKNNNREDEWYSNKLQINAALTSFGTFCINQSGWEQIQFGTAQQPSQLNGNYISSSSVTGPNSVVTTDAQSWLSRNLTQRTQSAGCSKITIFSRTLTTDFLARNQNAIVESTDRGTSPGTIDVVITTVN